MSSCSRYVLKHLLFFNETIIFTLIQVEILLVVSHLPYNVEHQA